jgi:hypothetical protein
LCDQSHKPADSGNFFRLDSAHQWGRNVTGHFSLTWLSPHFV